MLVLSACCLILFACHVFQQSYYRYLPLVLEGSRVSSSTFMAHILRARLSSPTSFSVSSGGLRLMLLKLAVTMLTTGFISVTKKSMPPAHLHCIEFSVAIRNRGNCLMLYEQASTNSSFQSHLKLYLYFERVQAKRDFLPVNSTSIIIGMSQLTCSSHRPESVHDSAAGGRFRG